MAHRPGVVRLVAQAVDSASDPEDKAQAIFRAGLGAPKEFDERFFARINSALSDEEPQVREAAVLAASYSPNGAYRKQRVAVRDLDDDEDLRDAAGVVLEAYDAEGVAEQ